MIELKRLQKVYDQQQEAVIKDVSVTIMPGEFFVMVGPSGSGKSTILRMIAGLEPITGGDLIIDGERMNDLPQKPVIYRWYFKTMRFIPT